MSRRHNFTRSHLKRSFYRRNENSRDDNENKEDCSSNTTIISDDELIEEPRDRYLYERVGVGFTEEER